MALHGVVVARGQEPALSRLEHYPLGLCPSIQAVQVPLQGLPTLWQIDTSPQLGIICQMDMSWLVIMSESKSSILLDCSIYFT